MTPNVICIAAEELVLNAAKPQQRPITDGDFLQREERVRATAAAEMARIYRRPRQA